MPLTYILKINKYKIFEGFIKTQRCEYYKSENNRCKRNVAIGTPLCWSHLLIKRNLKIKKDKKNKLNNYVIALNKKKNENDIVIQKDLNIGKYEGDLINLDEYMDRYKELGNVPFVLDLKKNKISFDNDNSYYIDNSLDKSFLSCIRFTEEKDKVNCELLLKDGNLFVKTIKDIKNNEELLLYDYEEKDYSRTEYISRYKPNKNNNKINNNNIGNKFEKKINREQIKSDIESDELFNKKINELYKLYKNKEGPKLSKNEFFTKNLDIFIEYFFEDNKYNKNIKLKDILDKISLKDLSIDGKNKIIKLNTNNNNTFELLKKKQVKDNNIIVIDDDKVDKKLKNNKKENTNSLNNDNKDEKKNNIIVIDDNKVDKKLKNNKKENTNSLNNDNKDEENINFDDLDEFEKLAYNNLDKYDRLFNGYVKYHYNTLGDELTKLIPFDDFRIIYANIIIKKYKKAYDKNKNAKFENYIQLSVKDLNPEIKKIKKKNTNSLNNDNKDKKLKNNKKENTNSLNNNKKEKENIVDIQLDDELSKIAYNNFTRSLQFFEGEAEENYGKLNDKITRLMNYDEFRRIYIRIILRKYVKAYKKDKNANFKDIITNVKIGDFKKEDINPEIKEIINTMKTNSLNNDKETNNKETNNKETNNKETINKETNNNKKKLRRLRKIKYTRLTKDNIDNKEKKDVKPIKKTKKIIKNKEGKIIRSKNVDYNALNNYGIKNKPNKKSNENPPSSMKNVSKKSIILPKK